VRLGNKVETLCTEVHSTQYNFASCEQQELQGGLPNVVDERLCTGNHAHPAVLAETKP